MYPNCSRAWHCYGDYGTKLLAKYYLFKPNENGIPLKF